MPDIYPDQGLAPLVFKGFGAFKDSPNHIDLVTVGTGWRSVALGGSNARLTIPEATALRDWLSRALNGPVT